MNRFLPRQKFSSLSHLSSLISHLKRGFTLIELLVVIGILTVLFAIVLIAVNPARQFAQANNTQRRSDINAILNAIHQYGADNKGVLPAGITATTQEISNSGANICSDLAPTYIAEIPRDPVNGTYTNCTTYNTGYTVVKSGNRVTVGASLELGPPSSALVTR